MSLDARRAGEALRAAAADLLRVWRSTRRALGDGASPVVLDGVMEEFLKRVAEGLLAGDPPEAIWRRTGGVVRLPCGPHAIALAEGDFRLAAGVLDSAGQALELAADVVTRIERAVEFAIASLPVDGPHRPPEVLVVRMLPARASTRAA